MTTQSTLLRWLDDPRTDRGIRFKGIRGQWEDWTFERLAALTWQAAAGLRAAGVGTDDVVMAVLPSGDAFAATLFGALRAGATPSPVATPTVFRDPERYAEHIRAVVGAASPRVLVTDEALVPVLADIVQTVAAAPAVVAFDELVRGGDPDRGAFGPLADLALLQFTSGSSGRPRGVCIGYEALEANVAAIQSWLRMTPDDLTASWLPIHHDMGLIGCLFTPIVVESRLWLFQPEEFIRRPVDFVRCFGKHGAALTAMPCFGLSYILRRVRPENLDGFDFSNWRALIIGAERIDARVVERFHSLMAPHGFRRATVKTAYGMAEATLAVTALPLEEEWTTLSVDVSGVGGQVALDEQAGDAMTCSGRPLPDMAVCIVDEDGNELPEGTVGEIVVTGSSVARGYRAATETASLTSITDGTVRSGDAGFLWDGKLYVIGRLGDSVKVLGRSLFAEDVEAVAVHEGLRPDQVTAVLGYRDGTPMTVVILEHTDQAAVEALAAVLRRRASGTDVIVLHSPRGTIERTSSGKPRRRMLWQAFCEGRLAGTEVGEGGLVTAGAGEPGSGSATR